MNDADSRLIPKALPARQTQLSVLLLAGLLFLRLVLLTGAALVLRERPGWIELVFDIGTYLLTAIFIWTERDRLAQYHITPLAVILILIAKPLMPLLIFWMGASFAPMSFPKPISFSYLVISLALFIALRRSHWRWGNITRGELRWLLWGGLAGLATVIATSYPMALSLRSNHVLVGASLGGLLLALIRIPQQLGYAAVTEEPLFRGILWGILRNRGIRDGHILIIQAVLFMLAHAYYFKSMPLSFWLVVPFGGLVFGLLAWRSRSISSSMVAHAMANAFGVFFAQIVGKWI